MEPTGVEPVPQAAIKGPRSASMAACALAVLRPRCLQGSRRWVYSQRGVLVNDGAGL